MDKKKKMLLVGGILGGILLILLIFCLIFNKKDETDENLPARLESIDTTTLPAEEVKKDLEDAKLGDKRLLFTIGYSSEKCPSPYLYIYNDNTYEYYDVLDKENIPEAKTGKIDYDLTKFAESLKEYPNEGAEAYSIRYKDLVYVTSISNNELRTILNSIDVVLDKCIIER